MNSMQVKDKLKNISKNKNIDFNTLLRLYMYDRFIERLAASQYKDNFILKGGFYLSTLFGLENRTTMDIDTAIKGAKFNKENVENMIKTIISIDIHDNSTIDFVDISNIREENDYGGFRVILCVKIDNMKETFQIDIATGDPITPRPNIYKYFPILGDGYIKVWSYNIETVIAEKLETILKRAEANGRTRDYYDLYLIYTKGWDKVNVNNLRKAIKKTFEKREYKGDIIETLNVLKKSILLKQRWQLYTKKYEYAKNIKYDEIMNCIEEIIDIIAVIVV